MLDQGNTFGVPLPIPRMHARGADANNYKKQGPQLARALVSYDNGVNGHVLVKVAGPTDHEYLLNIACTHSWHPAALNNGRCLKRECKKRECGRQVCTMNNGAMGGRLIDVSAAQQMCCMKQWARYQLLLPSRPQPQPVVS